MIRIGLLGYGNLSRGIEAAIKRNPDEELVAVFTVIHGTAYRRRGGRSDQYQIKTTVVCVGFGVIQTHNAQLTVVFVQHTHFSRSDVVVDIQFFCANNYAPPFMKQKTCRKHIPARKQTANRSLL